MQESEGSVATDSISFQEYCALIRYARFPCLIFFLLQMCFLGYEILEVQCWRGEKRGDAGF